MKIRKGMFVLNESDDLEGYYESTLSAMYIITDDEDLKLGLIDWLKSYSYSLIADTEISITAVNKNYKIQVTVTDGVENIEYSCYLISIPNAKQALSKSAK